MKRILFTLCALMTLGTVAAQPDTLDYHGSYYRDKLDHQEAVPVRPENIVMLGNSVTERGFWGEFFPDARILNRGIGGDCVSGMIARLDSIVKGQPRKIFVMAGVNDLIFSRITEEHLLRQYERLLDRIAKDSPRTRVYIQSLMPIIEERNTQFFTNKNIRIVKFNELLKEMAARRGLPYIDIWSSLLRDGQLREECTIDGIHLNSKGYEVWSSIIRPYITPADTYEGRVTCEGAGVAGVQVTDGLNIVQTDEQGYFALPHREKARFIYITVPSGYEAPYKEGVCQYYHPISATTYDYNFTLTRKSTDDTRHGFVVIADPQVYAEKEFPLLEQAADDIRMRVAQADCPMFGLSVGDLVSQDHTFYPTISKIVARTGLNFRHSMGNHDMKIWGRSNEQSPSAFEAMYGPSYYAFNVGKIHYVVLDDIFYIGRDWYYIGYITEEQLAWLEKDLATVTPGSTVVVAMHIPSLYGGNPEAPFQMGEAGREVCNFRALHAMLKPYNAHIITGHMHTTANDPIRENLYEHNVAALSGAWWQGPICTDGTPAGYAIFQVEGDNLTWYYQATGYDADYQMRLYDGQDDEAFAGRIVAHVWNSDPSWSVEVRIDGGKPVKMEQFRSVDPETKRLYADKSKLEHKWISPTASAHYFAAPLPEKARKVEVTVKDRFGNTYRATKKLKNK